MSATHSLRRLACEVTAAVEALAASVAGKLSEGEEAAG